MIRRLAAKILRQQLAKRSRAIIPTMVGIGRRRRIDVHEAHYTNEYVRLSQLELAAEEIYSRKTPGNVAELGVYRGDFAQKMNEAFPDRKLFLFDTFEGFPADQEEVDINNHSLSFHRDFSDTSAKIVLNRMQYPEKCVVCKGLFPDTSQGLENEKFCFVSLDADLYMPTLEGLKFFYPRLSAGGFIFVHDYNYTPFAGAKAAVIDFADQFKAPYVPMSDAYGTAIFRSQL
jgi:O-methyltransferase